MKSNLPIRIFVDAHVFDGEFQGTRTFIKGIYKTLSLKPELHIYLAARNLDILKSEFPESANISFLKFKSKSSIARLLYEIPALIRKHKIHYAHFQYISPIQKTCKFIVTIHDLLFIDYPDDFPFFYRWSRTLIFKRSSVNADILTTVSQYSRAAISRHFKIDAHKIHITPNGVSEIFFQPYDKSEARQFIFQKYGFENFLLYVSRIEPRKNHILLVKGFIELQLFKKGIELVLIGHKSIAASELDHFLESLSPEINRHIHLINDINNDELLQFYRAANIFIYPSKAEGFGIPPLEAAALKIPVLLSGTTAMSDFSFFGENMFDPMDHESFKRKLAALIDKPINPNQLNYIESVIRSDYSWSHSAESLYELIKADFLNS